MEDEKKSPEPEKIQEEVSEASSAEETSKKIEQVTEQPAQAKERPARQRQGGRRGGRRSDFKKQPEGDPEFIEKVLSIKRITKVTKGGKKLSFSALVVVGDGKGRVGYGHQKAGEVATAIRKSLNAAKKQMVKVTMKGTSIPHQIIGEWGGAQVLLKPASEGTGVIASGAVRAICDGAGIHNILTKCHRSNNPVNVVKATLDGLTHLKTVKKTEVDVHAAT